MNYSNEDLENIINLISENDELINNFNDNQVDYLINYLQVRIKEQEDILKDLKENANN